MPNIQPTNEDLQPELEAGLDLHQNPLEELRDEARRGVGKERRQIVMLILIVGGFMTLAHYTPLSSWLQNAQEWKRMLRDYGLLSHAAFMLLTALAVMGGVPRLTLCGTAGLLFGFVEGTLVSLIGSTLGSYGMFVMVRRGFRQSVASQTAGRPWLQRLLKKPSLMKVFWVRQLALPGVVLNAVLAVSEIRHRLFLAGTFLGYVPLNVAASLVGSGIGKENLQQTIIQLMAALAVINGVMWLVWHQISARKARRIEDSEEM